VREKVGEEKVVFELSDQVLPRTMSTSFFWAEHEAANTRIPDQTSILFIGVGSLLK
jgi:hypothetical protein